jgi:hypothetical protein
MLTGEDGLDKLESQRLLDSQPASGKYYNITKTLIKPGSYMYNVERIKLGNSAAHFSLERCDNCEVLGHGASLSFSLDGY